MKPKIDAHKIIRMFCDYSVDEAIDQIRLNILQEEDVPTIQILYIATANVVGYREGFETRNIQGRGPTIESAGQDALSTILGFEAIGTIEPGPRIAVRRPAREGEQSINADEILALLPAHANVAFGIVQQSFSGKGLIFDFSAQCVVNGMFLHKDGYNYSGLRSIGVSDREAKITAVKAMLSADEVSSAFTGVRATVVNNRDMGLPLVRISRDERNGPRLDFYDARERGTLLASALS